MLKLYQVKKLIFTDWKIAAILSLLEADKFGFLRSDTFDFQLKFSLKYTNFVLKKLIFPNDLHSLSILGKKICVF